MNLIDTYKLAENNDIKIQYYPLGSLAISTPDGYLGIDPEYETVESLIHEIGHIATGSFYSRESDDVLIHKAENAATNYSIRKLIPKKELDCIIKNRACVMPWQVAEHFEISIELAEKAIQYWKTH